MEYEWDESKSATNTLKHGIPFESMAGFDWSLSILLEVQWIDGEERELSIGPIGAALFSVVTVDRGEALRVVSLRRATRTEKTLWRLEFQNG